MLKKIFSAWLNSHRYFLRIIWWCQFGIINEDLTIAWIETKKMKIQTIIQTIGTEFKSVQEEEASKFPKKLAT